MGDTRLKDKGEVGRNLNDNDLIFVTKTNEDTDNPSTFGRIKNQLTSYTTGITETLYSKTGHTHTSSEITDLSLNYANLSGATFTGNISTAEFSANTLYSGSTELSSLFAKTSDIVNYTPQLNTKANLSGATFTGQINAPTISATTLSADTIVSDSLLENKIKTNYLTGDTYVTESGVYWVDSTNGDFTVSLTEADANNEGSIYIFRKPNLDSTYNKTIIQVTGQTQKITSSYTIELQRPGDAVELVANNFGSGGSPSWKYRATWRTIENEGVINVSLKDGTFSGITKAVNFANTFATSGTPIIVEISTGIYEIDEPIIVTNEYLKSIKGDSNQSTTIKPTQNLVDSGVSIVQIVNNECSLENITLDSNSTTGSTDGIQIKGLGLFQSAKINRVFVKGFNKGYESVSSTTIMTECVAESCNYGMYCDDGENIFSVFVMFFNNCVNGVYCNQADSRLIINDAVFYNPSPLLPLQKGMWCEAGLINTQVASIEYDSYVNNFFYVDGSSAKMVISTPYSESINLSNGIYNDNDGDVVMLSGKFFNMDKGFVIGTGGTLTRIVARGVSLRDSQTYDVDIQNPNSIKGFRGFNTCVRRDKFNNQSTKPLALLNYGYDSFENNFRTIGDTVIGIDGVGNTFTTGEGGTYKFNTKALTYDGSTYSAITDGVTFGFPNTSADTAIYFGDLDEHSFYAIQYDLNTLIDLGSGTIVWEYYDGGAADWVEFNSLTSLSTYSNSLNNNIFSNYSGYSHTTRFDQNIEFGVYNSNTSATGWSSTTINGDYGKWIRIRISTDITTTMTIDSPRMIGNATRFRTNGSQEFFGQARAKNSQLLGYSDFNGSANNTASVDISTNVNSITIQEGRLENGRDDNIYFRFQIPENLDTSCGITSRFGITSDIAGAQTGKLHLYYTIVTDNTNMDSGTNSETEIAFDFTGDTGYSAYDLKKIQPNKLIDVSQANAEDIVFFSLTRLANEAGDNAGDLDVFTIQLEYRQWQIGSSNLNI